MREITLETKIADLLNNFDGMKDTLIAINPKFKKLNNPVLRRTLAKLASVKQAAIIGGMEPQELVNLLRESVGQEPINIEAENSITQEQEAPSWIKQNPALTLDANSLLDQEKNPLAEVNIALRKLEKESVVALKSDFLPEPLIEEFKKQGKSVYTKKLCEDSFLTFIKSND